MKYGKQTRTVISALFLAMYMFVALISVHFHQHQHHESGTDTSISKLDKRFSADNVSADGENCFSCHMLYSNFSEVPSEFAAHFSSEFLYGEQLFAYCQQFGNVDILNSFLRGPPAA